MRPENMKSKPSENSELNRIEMLIQERISGDAKNIFASMLIFNTGQQQGSQNQDELHQNHIVSHNQEGTEQDEMTSQEIIANELDPKKKSEKNEEQVQQLLTLCGPLVESPGK